MTNLHLGAGGTRREAGRGDRPDGRRRSATACPRGSSMPGVSRPARRRRRSPRVCRLGAASRRAGGRARSDARARSSRGARTRGGDTPRSEATRLQPSRPRACGKALGSRPALLRGGRPGTGRVGLSSSPRSRAGRHPWSSWAGGVRVELSHVEPERPDVRDAGRRGSLENPECYEEESCCGGRGDGERPPPRTPAAGVRRGRSCPTGQAGRGRVLCSDSRRPPVPP